MTLKILLVKRFLTLFQLTCFLPLLTYASEWGPDIAKIRINDSFIYIQFGSPGLLKNGDFCYYDENGDYLCEVNRVIYQILSNPEGHDFYKELHIINLKNIPDCQLYFPDSLHVLKSKMTIAPMTDFENVEVEFVVHIEYGTAYSEDLSTEDNKWLTKEKVECLFGFDGETCDMRLYAIEGTVTKQRKLELKNLLTQLAKSTDTSLNDQLHKLYKQRIIMLGQCSC